MLDIDVTIFSIGEKHGGQGMQRESNPRSSNWSSTYTYVRQFWANLQFCPKLPGIHLRSHSNAIEVTVQRAIALTVSLCESHFIPFLVVVISTALFSYFILFYFILFIYLFFYLFFYFFFIFFYFFLFFYFFIFLFFYFFIFLFFYFLIFLFFCAFQAMQQPAPELFAALWDYITRDQHTRYFESIPLLF